MIHVTETTPSGKPQNGTFLRARFNPEQLGQAAGFSEPFEETQGRPQTLTHPVDQINPDTPSDRDDGIWVEEDKATNGYIAHVTIADVSARILPGTPLSNTAWQRGFTLYYPESTDPMFPRDVEHALSLENGQDRPGLEICIRLDAKFNPIHTEFKSVMTHCDCASYDQVYDLVHSASEDNAHDSERTRQFKLMNAVADGIVNHYFANNKAGWEKFLGEEELRKMFSGKEITSMKMVAAYMLLANNQAAEFANNATIPFIYRNFDERNDAHAHYSTTPSIHSGIAKEGIKGFYAHVTSPIRRGPDYFNGAMIHYAIDTLSRVETEMYRAYPTLNTERMHDAIWAQGTAIIETLLSPRFADVGERMAFNKSMYDIACNVAKDDNQPIPEKVHISTSITLPKLPYQTKELEHYAQKINAIAHLPEVVRIQQQRKVEAGIAARIQEISEQSAYALHNQIPSQFSSSLRNAANAKEMPDNLRDEALQRIHDGLITSAYDWYYLFLGVPRNEASENWMHLKRAAANIIKNDSSIIQALDNILRTNLSPEQEPQNSVPHKGKQQDSLLRDYVQKEIASLNLEEKDIDQEIPGEVRPDGSQRVVTKHTALLVLTKPNGSQFSAPFYSVGNSGKAARSHAIYSFLEHFAFAQLTPRDQVLIPNLNYVDLLEENPNKRKIIERMAEDAGATIEFTSFAIPEGNRTIITIQGGAVEVPIQAHGDGVDRDAATQSAMRHLLSNDAFKTAMAHYDMRLINPQIVLEELVTKRGGTVEMATSDKGPPFTTHITIHLGDASYDCDAKGPNKDRSIRQAAAKALGTIDTRPAPTHGLSWAIEPEGYIRAADKEMVS